MPFLRKNLARWTAGAASAAGNANVTHLFGYRTTDTRASVEGANWFLPAYKSLTKGALIMAVMNAGGFPDNELYKVTVSNATTLTVVRAERSTIRGEAAALSDATAGNITYTAAQILGGTIVRDPNGASRTDPLPTAALLVAAIPDAYVGQCIDCLIVNGADAAETITLTAGAGGAFDANQTAASRLIGQNASKLLRIRLTNVTLTTEAYVAYL